MSPLEQVVLMATHVGNLITKTLCLVGQASLSRRLDHTTQPSELDRGPCEIMTNVWLQGLSKPSLKFVEATSECTNDSTPSSPRASHKSMFSYTKKLVGCPTGKRAD